MLPKTIRLRLTRLRPMAREYTRTKKPKKRNLRMAPIKGISPRLHAIVVTRKVIM